MRKRLKPLSPRQRGGMTTAEEAGVIACLYPLISSRERTTQLGVGPDPESSKAISIA